MKRTSLGLLILLYLIGCDAIMGEEVGRLPINATSNVELIAKEATIAVKNGEEISFWTETDIEFEDELVLIYTVEIWKDTVKLVGFELDALDTNPTFMEVKTTLGNKTSWSYTGKMDFLIVEEDAIYTFKAALNSSDNSTLKINKAELVLKK